MTLLVFKLQKFHLTRRYFVRTTHHAVFRLTRIQCVCFPLIFCSPRVLYSLQVIPFLVLAIVDNVFIIVSAFQSMNRRVDMDIRLALVFTAGFNDVQSAEIPSHLPLILSSSHMLYFVLLSAYFVGYSVLGARHWYRQRVYHRFGVPIDEPAS